MVKDRKLNPSSIRPIRVFSPFRVRPLSFSHAAIRAFTDVADTMRRRLDALPPGERDDVEHASKILRRARGARQLPLINTASTTGAAG